MRAYRSLTILAVGVIVLVTACGDDDSADDSDSSAAAETAPSGEVVAEQLNERSFLSTDVTGQTLVEGTWLSLTFADDRLGASAGCNTMSGGFEIVEETLVVADLALTLMACPDDLAAQDEWFSALLTSSPEIVFADDVLTLTGADTTVVLADETTGPLNGTTWIIKSLAGPDGEVAAPIGASVTLTATTISVATGCNRGAGEARIGDGTLTIESLALTRMACEPELAEWEAALTAFLDGELTFEAADDQVVVTKGDQTLTLEPLA
jgi:heat shock protein HslJ